MNSFEKSNKVITQINPINTIKRKIEQKTMSDAACQTLSTGDIVITKIFFKEDQDKLPEKTITASPKKS